MPFWGENGLQWQQQSLLEVYVCTITSYIRVKRRSVEIPMFTGSQLLSPTNTNATFPLKRLKARIKRAHVLFESS